MPAKDDNTAKKDSLVVTSKTDDAKKEDVQVKKPKIKVEEVNTTPATPKITSFSQLDTKNQPLTKPEESEDKKEEESTKDQSEKDQESKDEKSLSSNEIKEWLSEVRPDTTKEVEKKGKSKFKILVIILIIIALAGLVVGGVYYYQSGFSKDETEESQEGASEPTQAPEEEEDEASPSAEIDEKADLSEYVVQALNGSGIAGEAGNVSDLLVGAGFAEVETGNADSYDYTTTIVSLKDSVGSTIYDEIKEALSENYIVEKSDEALEEDSTYDIKIIIGSQKAE